MSQPKNVLGTDLQSCSLDPLPVFIEMAVAAPGEMIWAFTRFVCKSRKSFWSFGAVGNDLSTPNPIYDFAGLLPGDRWCLCAPRWKEALEAGMAPQVVLESTHISTLEFVDLEELQAHSIEAPAQGD